MVKMFPSKSMVEYMSEMNRLFARTSNDDILQGNQYYMSQSPFNSTTTNQSSSSTDSTSPESFPEVTTYQNLGPIYETQTPMITSPRPMPETPKATETYAGRRQRPIVGRKIFSPESSTPERLTLPNRSNDYGLTPTWHEDVQFQPSPTNDCRNYYQNATYYELFPTENRFQQQVKTPVKTSPTMPNVSPSQSALNTSKSPSHSASPKSIDQSPMAPIVVYQRSPTPNRNFWPTTSRASLDMGPSKLCTFCRKNGESPIVYMTHYVKEKVGENKYIASCPILRSHVCSVCGATGDDAHTITYCPVLRNSNNGQPLQSTTITLKNTRIKSNGRRRF